ncbi:MAG: histidine triad nucleotide-binding protein [Clostridiales bacterium]|nr:histidine triad nucleotide-binding protein [Clostridiales bacterium]
MCLFCDIVAKKIPAEIVYEDRDVVAFKDINPQASVHVLLVPKIHMDTIREISEENSHLIFKVHEAAKEVAKRLGIYNKGYRLIVNCGEDAGQTVMHVHYHLLGGEKLGEKIV